MHAHIDALRLHALMRNGRNASREGHKMLFDATYKLFGYTFDVVVFVQVRVMYHVVFDLMSLVCLP